MEADRARVRVEAPTCPFCRVEIATGEPQLACNGCRAWHHRDCWSEAGGRCSACGGQESGLDGSTPVTAPAPQPRGRVVYRTGDGRRYVYDTGVGRYHLERLLIAGAGTLLTLLLALPVEMIFPAGSVGALVLVMIVATCVAEVLHDRWRRRYLDPKGP